jgi:hypothetical protein
MIQLKNKYLWAERTAAILAVAAVIAAGWSTADLSTRPISVAVGLILLSAAIRGVVSMMRKKDVIKK